MALRRYFYCGLALIVALSLAIATINADDDPAEAEDVPFTYTDQELIFIESLNDYRKTRGMQPVEICDELSEDCREWSAQMRQRGRLSHDPMGGTEICAVINQECGESALRIWQRSPGHNAVLLSSRIDTIGIGSDGNWWTMRGKQNNVEHEASHTPDANTEVERGTTTVQPQERTVQPQERRVLQRTRLGQWIRMLFR